MVKMFQVKVSKSKHLPYVPFKPIISATKVFFMRAVLDVFYIIFLLFKHEISLPAITQML